LYEKCGCMLAQKLKGDTFHITLHDLNNGVLSHELMKKMKQSERTARMILEELKENNSLKIRMRSTYLFNMMNTSVVLGFAPIDEEACCKLMSLYDRFQEVVSLSYLLTPHITIAYYKPGVYGMEQVTALTELINEINAKEKVEVVLDIEKLVYQQFSDMNHYYELKNQAVYSKAKIKPTDIVKHRDNTFSMFFPSEWCSEGMAMFEVPPCRGCGIQKCVANLSDMDDELKCDNHPEKDIMVIYGEPVILGPYKLSNYILHGIHEGYTLLPSVLWER